MKHITACVAGILLTMGLGNLGAQSPGALTVRLYNSTGLSADDVALAELVAEPILRNAGMNVTVRHCGGSTIAGKPLDRCADPLKPSEVIVRIIDAPKYHLTLGPQVFGVAYVVKGTTGGRLATLYSDRILDAALRVDVEPGTLLGRVLAHEVGHLLLGTSHHGGTGLMRADWPDALLNRTEAEEWRFSTGEAVTMQHVLATSARE